MAVVTVICPNKNVPEWKTMVGQIGERETYRAYIANDFVIPAAMSTPAFKRKIGIANGPFNSKQQSAINHELRMYNRQNGTSHRVKYTMVAPKARRSKVEVIFNYLPVDLEAQAQKRRKDTHREADSVQDGQSFLNVQDLNKTPFTPSEAQAEANRDEDQNFLPPSYSPVATQSKISRFQPYMDMKQNEIDHQFAELNRVNVKIDDNQRKLEKLEEAGKKDTEEYEAIQDEIMELRIQRQKINRNIGIASSQKARVSNLKSLEEIGKFAESDIFTLRDIFANEERTSADLRTARRIIDMWTRAGDFSGDGPHVFYDEEEFDNRTGKGLKQTTAKFRNWASRAQDYNADLRKLQLEFIEREIRAKDAFATSFIDFSKPLKDVGWLTQNALDISQTDNILLQITHRFVKDAMSAGHFELFDRHKKIEQLAKDTGLSDYSIFQQKFSNEDDRKTGELVYWFSYEYSRWQQNSKNRLKAEDDRALKQKPNKAEGIRRKANRKYIKELQKNTVLFDPRILFFDPVYMRGDGPTDEAIKAHKKELKDLLGEKLYDKYYALAEKKVENFKGDYIATKTIRETEYKKENAEKDLDVWMSRNSPFLHGEVIEKGFDEVSYGELSIYPTAEYVVHVPKREIEGKDSGFYDQNYADIIQNSSYEALHDELLDLFQESTSYLPNERVAFMEENSIPTLNQKTLEAMTGEDGNLAAGFTAMKREMLESVRMDDLSTTAGRDRDEDKQLQISMIQDQRQQIRDYIDLKMVEYRKNKPSGPKKRGKAREAERKEEAALKEKWRKEAILQAGEERSFDLVRLAKAFSTMAFAHKHKSTIEIPMRIMEEIIHNTTERKENAAGEPLTEKDDKTKIKVSKDKPENIIKMFDDFMETVYYNYPANRPEGKQTKQKIYTSKEKERLADITEGIKNLEELKTKLEEEGKPMSNAEYIGQLENFNRQLSELGGVAVASKFADHLLRYVQFLGMGWNGFAAMANMGFGFMANAIEAADGRNYSQANFFKAFGLVMNSAGRNVMFNMYDGRNGNALKIRAVMDRYDVLKQSKDELYKSGFHTPFKRLSKAFKWANPYSPQARTEYFNQAPVMIAILLEEKLTDENGDVVLDENGNEVSMWDAMDIEGNFKEEYDEYISLDKQLEVKSIIDQMVKNNHGNYDPDSRISAKRIWLGRALFQFRSWAPQGFAERLRTSMDDSQLTNRMTGADFVEKKGRYRSIGAYYQNNNGLGPITVIADLLVNLTRKMFFMDTTFQKMADDSEGSTFTSTDAANMRKNLTELAFLLGMMMIAALFKMGIDDDDDDPDAKKKRPAVNFLVNYAARLQTDILFYTSPVEFERLTKNAVPMFRIVTDSMETINALTQLITKGFDEDLLMSGTNKGESKTWNEAKDMLPIFSHIEKFPKAAQMIYKK